MALLKILEGTLYATDTEISFNDDSITDESIIEIYTDNIGVYPTAVNQELHTVTITFDPVATLTNIKLCINDIIDEFDTYDDLDSDETAIALSARQGKVLKGLIDAGTGAHIDYGTTSDFERDKESLPEGAAYLITDDYVPSYSNIYSTDEVRIGTFFDKPLYRKMVRKDSISKTAENINSLIGDWGIETAIKCTFISTGENEQGTVNCSLYKSNGSWLVFAWDSYSRATARIAYLAIEYTKEGE